MIALVLTALLAPQASSRPPAGVDPDRKAKLVRSDLPTQRSPLIYERRARTAGGGKDTEDAVAESLKALAGLQADDGSWDPPEGGSRVETTGLALLAFHGSGYSFWDQNVLPGYCVCRIASGRPPGGPQLPYHQVFRRGMAWVQGRQQADGFVGERSGPRSFRDHAIATRLFCEVYGFSNMSVLRDAAERSLAALIAEPLPSIRQDPDGACWAALALRSAMQADLPVDRDVPQRFLPEIAANSGPWTARLALQQLARPRSMVPAITLDPEPPAETLRDWYWGTIGFRLWDAPKGVQWIVWNGRVKAALLPLKPATPEAHAFRALTFEAYYNVNKVFGLK